MEGFPQAQVGTCVLQFMITYLTPRDLCTAVRVHRSWRAFLKDLADFQRAFALREKCLLFHKFQRAGTDYLQDPNWNNPLEISPTQVEQLLQWLYQIALYYGVGVGVQLWSEVVHCLHCYLARRSTPTARLQLVGCAVLLVSFDQKDSAPPLDATALSRACYDMYTESDILSCAADVRELVCNIQTSNETYLATRLLLQTLCPSADHPLLWYIYELFTFEYEYHTLQAKDTAAAIVQFYYKSLIGTRGQSEEEFLGPYPTPTALQAVTVMYKDAHS